MNQKELFWISVTVFLTILAWMFIDIYRIKSNVPVNTGLQNLQIVDFKLDTRVLQVLKDKTP